MATRRIRNCTELLCGTARLKSRLAVAENVWERGGIVAAVCHGPVLLPGVVDSGTGKSIIEGKTVTGFTIEGEVVLEVWGKLTSDGVAPVVEAVTKTGADYSSPMHPFDDYSITAGRVITGANPASATQRSRTSAQGIRRTADGAGARWPVCGCGDLGWSRLGPGI